MEIMGRLLFSALGRVRKRMVMPYEESLVSTVPLAGVM